jgi:hypothetical protein
LTTAIDIQLDAREDIRVVVFMAIVRGEHDTGITWSGPLARGARQID